MPWFRPTRRVEGPSGQLWEIYVTRGGTPAWRPAEYPSPTETCVGPLVLLGLLVELPMFLLAQVVWPLVRLVPSLPWTLVRAARARQRTIEAIAFAPHEDYVWRAPAGEVPRVVDEIAAGLASGHVPRPAGATFLGGRHEGDA